MHNAFAEGLSTYVVYVTALSVQRIRAVLVRTKLLALSYNYYLKEDNLLKNKIKRKFK